MSILPRASYATCSEVSPECPVSATTYGYTPNLGVNSFFIAFFASCLIIQLIIGLRTRTWTYTIALGIGTFGECVGYIGRVLMHFNPWNVSGFEMQVCCLVLAPSFVAAAIYLTLKHLVLYYGPEYSRLQARLYPWIFVGCDFGSIILQAVGGGVAASAGNGRNYALLKAGDNLIVAGIAFQVATMAVCGVLMLDYFVRFQKAKKADPLPTSTRGEKSELNHRARTAGHMRLFIAAVVFAYFTVLIRCIYRIPEMAGGWGNPRMQRENDFLLLDGMMIGFATLALTAVHPGIFFPPMRKQKETSL